MGMEYIWIRSQLLPRCQISSVFLQSWFCCFPVPWKSRGENSSMFQKRELSESHVETGVWILYEILFLFFKSLSNYINSWMCFQFWIQLGFFSLFIPAITGAKKKHLTTTLFANVGPILSLFLAIMCKELGFCLLFLLS